MWRRILVQAVAKGDSAGYRSFSKTGCGSLNTICTCEKAWRTSNLASKVENTWRNEYGNRNDKKQNDFAYTKRILPAFLIMAVGFSHEETDLSDAEILKNEDQAILDLLHKGKKMLETKCSLESIEKVYTEALHLALAKKDKSAIAYVQDQLANLGLRQGHLEKSEQLFKNVIRNLLDSGMKENNTAIIEISLKLATIYAGTGKDDFAVSGYDWVLEKCRENLKTLKNDPKSKKFDFDYKNQIALLGMALDSYGRYLYMNGKHKQALDVTREACEISMELFGENDVRTLVIFNDIGAILNSAGEFKEASTIIEKAILIASKSKYCDHADVAIFWVNLASIYKKQKNVEKMTDAFENARKEAKLSNDKALQSRIEQHIKQIGVN